MATLPPESTAARGPSTPTAASPEALAQAWDRLHGQAGQLAMLARIAAEPAQTSASITQLFDAALPWQRVIADQTMADAATMLDCGLTALATLSQRGQDAAAPALVLWREFHAARNSLLVMLECPGAA
jgi:hypothetical protein